MLQDYSSDKKKAPRDKGVYQAGPTERSTKNMITTAYCEVCKTKESLEVRLPGILNSEDKWMPRGSSIYLYNGTVLLVYILTQL